MSEDAQQQVIDFLGDAGSHAGVPVKRIDTHAAMVFLAGGRVLKIKRAVRFPFLDFSTLSKRRVACEAEVKVNRAFAPAIYRGVLPITRDAAGRLAIAGKGEPVEWAVEMRRFDESQTLDRIAWQVYWLLAAERPTVAALVNEGGLSVDVGQRVLDRWERRAWQMLGGPPLTSYESEQKRQARLNGART